MLDGCSQSINTSRVCFSKRHISSWAAGSWDMLQSDAVLIPDGNTSAHGRGSGSRRFTLWRGLLLCAGVKKQPSSHLWLGHDSSCRCPLGNKPPPSLIMTHAENVLPVGGVWVAGWGGWSQNDPADGAAVASWGLGALRAAGTVRCADTTCCWHRHQSQAVFVTDRGDDCISDNKELKVRPPLWWLSFKTNVCYLDHQSPIHDPRNPFFFSHLLSKHRRRLHLFWPLLLGPGSACNTQSVPTSNPKALNDPQCH